ncbi:MAG: TlpA family protein disulfide reductase [Bernardetiaceae bacterium]|nr:TlpA family protein disulfide reductase [Bernardetiaceae bacterium]
MKHISLYFLTCMAIWLCAVEAKAQNEEKSDIPEVAVADLKGNKILIHEELNTDGPTLISFWATWCKPCINELNAIHDDYIDWQDDTGVKVIAISIDDSRSRTRVPTIANGKGWEFDVYIDENSDLRRALNVNNVPHTFILDKNGKIIYQHTAYNPGDEYEYLRVLREYVASQK